MKAVLAITSSEFQVRDVGFYSLLPRHMALHTGALVHCLLLTGPVRGAICKTGLVVHVLWSPALDLGVKESVLKGTQQIAHMISLCLAIAISASSITYLKTRPVRDAVRRLLCLA